MTLKDYVLVLGDDEYSARQLQFCQQERPEMRGVIQCDVTPAAAMCEHVQRFPAFCDMNDPAVTCQYGLRDTTELLASVVKKPA